MWARIKTLSTRSLSSPSRRTSSLVPLLATETLNLGHPKSLTVGPGAVADLQDCGRRDAVGVEVIIHSLFSLCYGAKGGGVVDDGFR